MLSQLYSWQCEPLIAGGFSDLMHIMVKANPLLSIQKLMDNIAHSSTSFLIGKNKLSGIGLWPTTYNDSPAYVLKSGIYEDVIQQVDVELKIGFIQEQISHFIGTFTWCWPINA